MHNDVEGAKLHHSETKNPPTVERMKESMKGRVGEPITLDEFMNKGRLACVDGRENKEVVGAPGGTAGEFLLMLASFEKAQGKTIKPAEVQPVLERYLENVPRFYLHTDTHALHHLEKKYERFDIQTGEGADRETLLNELAKPEHIGCGHLKYMMLQGKENYHIRSELVREFLKALYRLLWEGEKKIELVIIEGDHHEGAVVTVVVSGSITPETKLPLVKPNTEEGQVFMYHPQAAEALRERIIGEAEYIFGQSIDKKKFAQALSILSSEQLNATLSNLASGKPIFTAHFNQSGELVDVL